MLSGSASKGNKYYYHYYHCKAPCGVRYRAEEVNKKFKTQLRRLIPRPGRLEIYSDLLLARFKEEAKKRDQERRNVLQELDKVSERMQNARIKMVDGLLSADDFQQLKEHCSKQITDLEKRLNNFSSDHGETTNLLKKTLTRLEHLVNLYESWTLEEKKTAIRFDLPRKFGV